MTYILECSVAHCLKTHKYIIEHTLTVKVLTINQPCSNLSNIIQKMNNTIWFVYLNIVLKLRNMLKNLLANRDMNRLVFYSTTLKTLLV